MTRRLTQQELLARAALNSTQKYGNRATWVDGHRFASQKEAARYSELRILEKAGRILELVLQPVYPLYVNGIRVATYIADFLYTEDGRRVVEDVKGVKTQVYSIKKRLMLACYGIEIRES